MQLILPTLHERMKFKMGEEIEGGVFKNEKIKLANIKEKEEKKREEKKENENEKKESDG